MWLKFVQMVVPLENVSKYFFCQDVTTRAKYISCQPGKKCKTETGYYLDPKKPCKTYDPFGHIPQVSQDSASIMCVWPGELTKVFRSSENLLDYTTLMVDETQE